MKQWVQFEFRIGNFYCLIKEYSEEDSISEIPKEEIEIASKIQLSIFFIEMLQKLVIENKEEIINLLLQWKPKIFLCITNGLQSSRILNKIKAIRLFKTLWVDGYFDSEEIKQILNQFIRPEYRKYHSLEFVQDAQNEIKQICNAFPYEVHECFADDIEIQYEDFKKWRQEEYKYDPVMETEGAVDFSIMHQVTSSLGITLEMFLVELEWFQFKNNNQLN